MTKIENMVPEKRLQRNRLFWMLVIFIIGIVIIATTTEKHSDQCECNCPGHYSRDAVEAQYESLVPPIHVEAVGFQGIILRDAIGSAFVVTDDKALHEILEYSYNVGDTIR